MPGHIHDTMTIAARGARLFTAFALTVSVAQGVCAKPGGEPLVLDTQTGIHSGTSGTVLQSGTLGGPGMVPMATLPGLPQQADPPIVVSPYVEYPGGQNSVPMQPGGSGRPRIQRGPRAPYP